VLLSDGIDSIPDLCIFLQLMHQAVISKQRLKIDLWLRHVSTGFDIGFKLEKGNE